MKPKQAKLAILVFTVVLLAILPTLVGCAKEEGAGKVIKIGVLADFTGTAAYAMQPFIQTIEDYFTRVLPDKNPLGVKVEFTRFDTQLDYSRTIPGYLTLKGRGVDMMIIPNAQDREIIGKDRLIKDKMPCVGSQGLEAQLVDDWTVSSVSTVQSQGEAIMLFIMDHWDYEGKGRSPRVGHLGYTLQSTEYYQQGIDRVRQAYPGKFEWAGVERGTLGNVVWTSEVGRLKNCDYIVVTVAGPMLSSFVSQARAAGYTGVFVTGNEGFPGFFDLVKGEMKGRLDQLYGCYYLAWWPWWNEDVALIRDVKEYIQTYRSDKAGELLASSSPISGWGIGLIIEDAIRRAIDAVGVKNVDRTALRDALKSIDMEVPGYPERWRVTANNNCISWWQRAFEWKVDQNEWVPLPDYYKPVLSRPSE